ncbi:helix-turn-helix domain-containing protein [Actinomadura barringtoniae]|uniref:Helix-turn-helix domain-containing protein n=1 Tax=Actinomadura barringtoniae TaxID=1427535 RepID=A0A939PPQ2_9ACTN|nr:helix-turn-helix domain-containing protein [Actinomadura barringtoniae]
MLLHPVRLRIVHAMSGGRTLTTSELCAHLPDVPRTTAYRHVALLADAGVLEVVDEQRVHGAVERRYRLRRERTVIDRDMAATMTLEDHRKAFAAAMAVLHAEFNAYLDRDGADPVADLVGYTQFPIWMDRDELNELIGEFTDIVMRRRGNEPRPGRTPYLMSPIFFPTEEPSQED